MISQYNEAVDCDKPVHAIYGGGKSTWNQTIPTYPHGLVWYMVTNFACADDNCNVFFETKQY